MNTEEKQYLNLLKNILENGSEQQNRTGVPTKAVFGTQMKFSLRDNSFPLLTTRKIFYRGAIEEFLWMFRGDTNANHLKEKNVHIWDGNTTKEFIEKRGLKGIVPEGDIGTLYGYQMRNWGGDYNSHLDNQSKKYNHDDENFGYENERDGIDQVAKLVYTIKKDPLSRRLIISNWNVSQLQTGVLEPCHVLYQFKVDTTKNELSGLVFQRSVDSCCGLPINIAYLSVMTIVLAKITGYNPGEITWCGGDTHIYQNHYGNAKIQIGRKPFDFPKLIVKKDIKTVDDIENMVFEDFELVDYKHHEALKYEMAV